MKQNKLTIKLQNIRNKNILFKIQIIKMLFVKLQDAIQTQRTIDTPQNIRVNDNFLFKSLNKQSIYTQRNNQIYSNQKKYFLPNQNSKCSIQQQHNDSQKLNFNKNKNNFSISQQFNQTNNQLNATNKSKSLPRQQQNSRTFNLNKSQNQTLTNNKNNTLNRSQNITSFDSNSHQHKNIKRIQGLSKSKSLSKKTEKLNFNSNSKYIQEVKGRKFFNSYKNQRQREENSLTRINNKLNLQPRLNLSTCERYCQDNSFKSSKISPILKEIKNNKYTVEDLFPKSNQFFKDKEINRNPFYSKTYNFNIQQTHKNFRNNLEAKRQSKVYNYLDYSKNNANIYNSTIAFTSRYEREKLNGYKSISLKKTENIHLTRVDFSKNLINKKISSLQTWVNNVKNQQKSNQDENMYILVQNVPQNILIQQQDIRLYQELNRNQLLNPINNRYDYDKEQNLIERDFHVENKTKLFMCTYCLQIYNIFQLKYHKGKVCNIAHSLKEFMQKLNKVKLFLTQIYENYYQKRQIYNCFQQLAYKIQKVLSILQNEDQFRDILLKLQGKYDRKQNYSKQNLKRNKIFNQRINTMKRDQKQKSIKDQYLLSQIQQQLKLKQFLKLQEVFQAVYKLINQGKQHIQTNIQQTKIKNRRPTIIIVKDLFWLINKLIQSIFLFKLQQLHTFKQTNYI